MQINFSKYQGTGNDFVLIDNRKNVIDPNDTSLISLLCHRKFGIGADGLMLLEDSEEYDFTMRYFNSDGKEASMCGNGGRCIVAFAHQIGIIKNNTQFIAIDGVHQANLQDVSATLTVSLKMQDVSQIEQGDHNFYLNTGSPHYVEFLENQNDLDVYQKGHAIRYSKRFAKEGTNVNFVTIHQDYLQVTTYERGVEDETLSCGTGVVASALCASITKGNTSGTFKVQTKGGKLSVHYQRNNQNQFSNIWLEGPATLVFNGSIKI